MVKGMPYLLKIIGIIGTAAMLWVGGNIIVHGLEVLGWHWPYDTIKGIAKSVGGESGFAHTRVRLMGSLGMVSKSYGSHRAYGDNPAR